MATSTAADEAITREGIAALQRGDAAAARRAFESLLAAGAEPPWLLLAQACRMTGDFPAEEAAVDRLLAGRPRDIWGLIVKADARTRAGDARAASTFYDAALKAAAQLPS
ncbi:MAG: aspartyl/asparaginyl beta-hydroxylase domain-containing protein, partial [Sphingomonadaceae bacterium]|nr:aspartyl/asparaginyl beta-hydroxylase domain-containing protein [Sphingomonadaceae bacterium]